GHEAAIHAAHGEILRARGYLHDRRRGASEERLETGTPRRYRRRCAAVQHFLRPIRRDPMQRLLAAFAAACLATLANAEDRIPIESFFKLPEYASMRLSPDGKNIAALAPFRGKQ